MQLDVHYVNDSEVLFSKKRLLFSNFSHRIHKALSKIYSVIRHAMHPHFVDHRVTKRQGSQSTPSSSPLAGKDCRQLCDPDTWNFSDQSTFHLEFCFDFHMNRLRCGCFIFIYLLEDSQLSKLLSLVGTNSLGEPKSTSGITMPNKSY